MPLPIPKVFPALITATPDEEKIIRDWANLLTYGDQDQSTFVHHQRILLALVRGLQADVVTRLAVEHDLRPEDLRQFLALNKRVTTPNVPATGYKSKAAREAQAGNYGDERYWAYLDNHAQELHDKFIAEGDTEQAKSMFTRSLSESLKGNDGL